jgi:hypothetical protein
LVVGIERVMLLLSLLVINVIGQAVGVITNEMVEKIYRVDEGCC